MGPNRERGPSYRGDLLMVEYLTWGENDRGEQSGASHTMAGEKVWKRGETKNR